MVGSFDYDSIKDQEDKVTQGLLRTRETSTKSIHMILSPECAIQEQPPLPEDTTEDDEEFQAMLAEILAEEEARQAELNEGIKDKKVKKVKKTK